VVVRQVHQDVDEFDVDAAGRCLKTRQQLDDLIARRGEIAIVKFHPNVGVEVFAKDRESCDPFLSALGQRKRERLGQVAQMPADRSLVARPVAVGDTRHHHRQQNRGDERA